MATLWLTYAWSDNKNSDVDYIAQELVRSGINVKLDRWNINAGKRLWEQIGNFIQNPEECDGWVLYATQNSLGSESCKEEFAYAIDRALYNRGNSFPVIGLFPTTVDKELIPAGIKTRLYVSTADPNWKERIKSSLEGRAPNINKSSLEPYLLEIHNVSTGGDHRFAIEVRPRAGTWSPFLVAIPNQEKENVSPHISFGACGRVPTGVALFNTSSGLSEDEKYWCMTASNEASPTQSYYILCKTLPRELIFGIDHGQPQYTVVFNK
ncbi:MAG: hypothetical protein A2Y48_05895 [Nitrospirae bacterium RIFCSPLOW2_12_42_9]|nr:MAG: hypothetical protein A2Y48_05895 [Nitrospirae bacterium RIFCSPLOW2_12_42_9]HBI24136.1 hypothetical protein [Nitrospiraceae bacterium]HKZ56395.1 toll/interleukin-1 receptor domain-containing protein [Thermodesulfovibrionales bacterium]